MYFAEDENFARQLQNEFHAFEDIKLKKEKLNESLNPVDLELEYIDPTPSIHDLFVKFDRKFFWNKLGMVEVSWSHRMTSCAGLCSFEGGRGLCKISLSAPLLSLRPRKDLVETLLHEMIHAYLFVTHNYKDREDHGPEFHKHMFRINKEAGTRITVYHKFFDEVEYYQKHIWRCNGRCQLKKPHFGFVKRAMNRPPGPNDPWWFQHKLQCNGIFVKISEPEKKPIKSRKIAVVNPKNKDIKDIKDIKFFFNQNKTEQKIFGNKTTSNIKTLANIKNQPVSGVKTNMGTGTIIVTNTKRERKPNIFTPINKNSTENKTSINQKGLKNVKVSNGKEITFGKDSGSKGTTSGSVTETVRNIWGNKFPNSVPKEKQSPKKEKLECPVCNKEFTQEEIENHVDECLKNKDNSKSYENSKPNPKKLKLECPVCNNEFIQEEIQNHVDECLKNKDNSKSYENSKPTPNKVKQECPSCNKGFSEEEFKNHLNVCLKSKNNTDNYENSQLGTSTSQQSFVRETVRNIWGNKFPNSVPKEKPSPKKEKLVCPSCNKEFTQEEIQNHMDVCLKNKGKSKSYENSQPGTSNRQMPKEKPSPKKEKLVCPSCNKEFTQEEIQNHVDECLKNKDKSKSYENSKPGSSTRLQLFVGGTVRKISVNKPSNSMPKEKPSPKKEKLVCPSCNKEFTQEEMDVSYIQNHMDVCLKNKDKSKSYENSQPGTSNRQMPKEKPSPKKEKLVCPSCNKEFTQEEIQNHLDVCLKNKNNTESYENSKPSPKKVKLECPSCNKGFSEEEFKNHLNVCLKSKNNIDNYENSQPGTSRNCQNSDEYKKCPVCNGKILESEMNDHLESCLNCSFENEDENEFGIELKNMSVPCPCCYRWYPESQMNYHIDECLSLNI